MKFREMVSRVTGISCPVFGVQWNPPETECAVARRAVVFLEDRRVLFTPSSMEVPHDCVESVLRIREYLTGELQKLDSKAQLAGNLRAMRAACRKFLDTVQTDDRNVVRFGGQYGHWASWVFNGALGELRGVFGIHVLQIALAHGLDIEDELAAILPSADSVS